MTHSQQMSTQDNNRTFFYVRFTQNGIFTRPSLSCTFPGYDSPVKKVSALPGQAPNVTSVDVEQGCS